MRPHLMCLLESVSACLCLSVCVCVSMCVCVCASFICLLLMLPAAYGTCECQQQQQQLQTQTTSTTLRIRPVGHLAIQVRKWSGIYLVLVPFLCCSPFFLEHSLRTKRKYSFEILCTGDLNGNGLSLRLDQINVGIILYIYLYYML